MTQFGGSGVGLLSTTGCRVLCSRWSRLILEILNTQDPALPEAGANLSLLRGFSHEKKMDPSVLIDVQGFLLISRLQSLATTQQYFWENSTIHLVIAEDRRNLHEVDNSDLQFLAV